MSPQIYDTRDVPHGESLFVGQGAYKSPFALLLKHQRNVFDIETWLCMAPVFVSGRLLADQRVLIVASDTSAIAEHFGRHSCRA